MEKSKFFSLIILIMTLIGFILILVNIYNISINLITMIIVIGLYIAQMVIAINDLTVKKFLSEDAVKIGLFCASLALLFFVVDGTEALIQNPDEKWWSLLGFYAGSIPCLINIVIFLLKTKIK